MAAPASPVPGELDRGHGCRPRGTGSGGGIALDEERQAGSAEQREIVLRFDALGDERGADVGRELMERAQKGLAARVVPEPRISSASSLTKSGRRSVTWRIEA